MHKKMTRIFTGLSSYKFDIRRIRLWWLPFVLIGILILFSSLLNGSKQDDDRDSLRNQIIDDSELDDIVDDPTGKKPSRWVQRNVPKTDKHLINDWMTKLQASKDGCLQVDQTSRGDLPMCSNSLFRLYYSSKHAFPECGKWYSEVHQLTASYDLDFCLWQPYHMPECYTRKQVKHLLVVGDNSAIKLFVSLLNVTQAMGGVCSVVQTEGINACMYNHNSKYYADILGDLDYIQALDVQKRNCCYCRPQKYRCLLNFNHGPFEIDFEFLPSATFSDTSLTISEEKAAKFNFQPAANMQEFIYKTYLPKTGYPDVIINALPMFAQKDVPWDVTEASLRQWIHLINQYKPKETEVYWIPGATECEQSRPRIFRHQMHQPRLYEESMQVTDWIYKLNTRIYHILEPFLLNRDLNMHGFMNLANMSSTRCDWSYNGVYFQNIWYHKVLWKLFSLMCSEVE